MKKDTYKNDDFYPWGFSILEKWVQLLTQGRNLKLYFEDNYMQSVAIYGFGTLGKRLFEQLNKDGIIVSYIIDKKKDSINIDGVDIFSPEEELPSVDVVIVTPIFFYEIEEVLQKRYGVYQNIISIEDVIQYCVDAGE